jgi:hypothetical protein
MTNYKLTTKTVVCATILLRCGVCIQLGTWMSRDSHKYLSYGMTENRNMDTINVRSKVHMQPLIGIWRGEGWRGVSRDTSW